MRRRRSKTRGNRNVRPHRKPGDSQKCICITLGQELQDQKLKIQLEDGVISLPLIMGREEIVFMAHSLHMENMKSTCTDGPLG